MFTHKSVSLRLVALSSLSFLALSAVQAEEARWWRGNTHTHSWWSDGDAPPETIAKWYKSQGYQFLVISDHNIMQRGEKWYPVDQPPRRPEAVRAAFDRYVDEFGDDWVEVRGEKGEREVRLKTLNEFRHLFEESERFLFINGEEITDRHEHHPVHLNGVNLVDLVEPQGGDSVADTIQNNMDAVIKQSNRHAQPMVVHLNHPNFHFAVTAEDFFQLEHEAGDGFFEMYNGHSGVHTNGDAERVSSERLWDIVLANRLGTYDRSVIYGVATDDAHEFSNWGPGFTNPGRGWIMVRSTHLTPNKITAAVRRGDFYNSTGIELDTLEIDDSGIRVSVDEQPGVDYTVEFVGTRVGTDLSPVKGPETPESEGGKPSRSVYSYSEDIGEVLARVDGPDADYHIRGDELYVRARVISTRRHGNPFAEGDVEMAWTQPIVVNTESAED